MQATPTAPEHHLRASSSTEPLHPRIRARLRPGEAVVWTGRPEPRRLSRLSMIFFALLAAFGAVFVVQAVRTGQIVSQAILFVPFFAYWFGMLAVLGWRSITLPLHETYVLTTERVMALDPRWPMTGGSFSADGKTGLKITCLTIIGHEIRLNDGVFTRSWPRSLRGVTRPAEIAALIKSTLKLDLPIEDQTS